ncbi:hypothetical protein D3C78_1339250 [compost metagenome]
MLFAFFKQTGALADIRIDPYANFQAFFFKTFQHAYWVRKYFFVPFKVSPMEAFHPEAVKMEYVQRQISLRHAIYK